MLDIANLPISCSVYRLGTSGLGQAMHQQSGCGPGSSLVPRPEEEEKAYIQPSLTGQTLSPCVRVWPARLYPTLEYSIYGPRNKASLAQLLQVPRCMLVLQNHLLDPRASVGSVNVTEWARVSNWSVLASTHMAWERGWVSTCQLST